MRKNLEIYIHIPFCVKKCLYCDFLSLAVDDNVKDKYVNMLIDEIKNFGDAKAYIVTTIFIGGGTPSILKPHQICHIMEAVSGKFTIADEAEVTIECNPGTVSIEKLQLYKKAGINRISFGLQSANNEELAKLGRIHSFEQFLESYKMATDAGFDNINVDLMSAVPYQTISSYGETLEKIMSLGPLPAHVSAYSLIVEEQTPLKEWLLSEGYDENTGNDSVPCILPSEEEERKMYYLTKQVLKENGYVQYEISNFAKEGYDCKHNCGYWTRKEYIGFGIGAASLIDNTRWNNTKDINKYIENISENKFEKLKENIEKLSPEEQMSEFMFLGLRMNKGISKAEFRKRFGRSYEEVYGKVSEKLVQQGLIIEDEDNIRLSEKGVDVSNCVMVEFIK